MFAKVAAASSTRPRARCASGATDSTQGGDDLAEFDRIAREVSRCVRVDALRNQLAQLMAQGGAPKDILEYVSKFYCASCARMKQP